MSFLDAAAGFATGFADELVRQQDIQRAEDREREKELIAAAKAEAKTFSERKRAHEQMLQKSHQLHQVTGMGDPGAFFQLQTLGFDPKDIVNMVQENPNLFTEMGISTTRGQSTGQQSQFDAGIDILDEFGGPTVEAGEALDNRRAQTATERDADLLARTIIGEAASEPVEGQIAVANVVMNRLNSGRWGDAMDNVLFARHQFEPWTNPEVRRRLENIPTSSPQYQKARRIADAVISGQVPDITNGATHFANPDVVRKYARDGRASSSTLQWVERVEREGMRIGRHVFGNPDGPSTGGGQMRTTMSTSGQIDPTDQQMAGAFSDPTVTPRMEIPQQPEPQQEQSGLDRFRTGFQRVFGMDDESRNQRIQSNVDAFRSRAGLDQPQSGGGGFASMPQSNFRLNLGGDRGADLSPLIGRDADWIDQWMTLNGGNLSADDLERVNTIRGIATRTEDKEFNVFNEIKGAYSDNKLNAVFDYVRTSPDFTEEERAENLAVLDDVMTRRQEARNGNLMDQYQNDLVRYQRMLTQGTDEEREEAARWFNQERPIIENALGAAGQITARAEATMLEGLGFDPDIAMLAALGHLEVITDPVNREHRVIDSAGNIVKRISTDGTDGSDQSARSSATNLARDEYTAARDAADTAISTLLDEMQGSDISAGLGIPGRLSDFANTVAGAFGSSTAPRPEADTAYRLLETLDVYTRLIVTQSLTNLRGSVYVLEMLQELNLTPGEFITAQGAQQRLGTIRQRISDDVRNLEDIASGRTGAQPSAVSDARVALPDMRTLLSYYEAMEQSFNANQASPTGRNFLGNPNVDPENRATTEQPATEQPRRRFRLIDGELIEVTE